MHHSRRKSGHGSANTSMTDVRKATNGSSDAAAAAAGASSRHKSSRPAPSSSRKSASAVSPQSKAAKTPRDREKDWDEEQQQRWWEEERESFPQYCMTCEKQFIPQDDMFLYCSEACRIYDQNNTNAADLAAKSQASYPGNYPFYASGEPEPRDIIPRASPSRPTSTHFSPPTTPGTVSQTSAIAALRSLSIRDPSPPSPTITGAHHSSIWPFTRSAAASPSTSYTRPASGVFSSTYDNGYYRTATPGYGMTSTSSTSMSMERPLPSRRPGPYSSRPKSIELVTPMVGR